MSPRTLRSRPPTRSRASCMTTAQPAARSLRAALRPAIPAPTTTTSTCRGSVTCRSSVADRAETGRLLQAPGTPAKAAACSVSCACVPTFRKGSTGKDALICREWRSCQARVRQLSRDRPLSPAHGRRQTEARRPATPRPPCERQPAPAQLRQDAARFTDAAGRRIVRRLAALKVRAATRGARRRERRTWPVWRTAVAGG